jgi:ferritin-like metal-binding protein YciE
MKVKTLHDLFVHELKDLYSAEKQLLKALPQMEKAASNPQLKAGFERHLAETEEQVTRLEQICGQFEIKPSGVKCKAMEGLIEEGKMALTDIEDDDVRDAALIAAAQRVEHYEIAGYGCARTFAEQLGFDDAVQLLQLTLDEEKATDEKLTQIALQHVNAEAGVA